MPIARIQLPNGKIGRFEVPEGTTPDQVLKFAEDNAATFAQSAPPEQPKPAPSVRPGPEMMPSHESTPMARAAAMGRAGVFPDAAGTFETAALPYRPAFEGAGAALGALAGTWAGPVGQVAGGSLGYAGGKRLADVVDEARGISAPMGMTETAIETAEDLGTGAALEMGGQLLAPAFMAVKTGGKWALENISEPIKRAFTQRGAERAAGEILSANTSRGTIYAKNAEEAAEIEKAIPGLKFTRGQQTGDPALVKLERTQMRRPGSAADLAAEQEIANNEAIRKFYGQNFGGKEGIEDLTSELQRQRSAAELTRDTAQQSARGAIDELPYATPQQTGTDIVAGIRSAQQPVKQAMGRLESQIPDYPMGFENTEKSIAEALSSKKLSVGQRQAIEKFQDDLTELKRRGQTTHTAFGVRRTLNDTIESNFAAGNNSAAKALLAVRDGLEADLAGVSSLARSGQLKTFEGKTVFPDELASELERNAQTIASIESTRSPDVQRMISEISSKGGSPMRVYGESDAGYLDRIQKEYRRMVGGDIPVKETANTKALAELNQRNDQIRKILQNVEPGKDVASAMRAYNQFASEQFFGRFDKGAVAQATAKGQQATGTRARPESIPSTFTTPTGADDLIRALGQDEASKIMTGHYAYDLAQNVIDPTTGLVQTSKLNRWMAQNSKTLDKYGIKNNFSGIAKAQKVADAAQEAVVEFERSAASRILGADPERAIAAAFSGRNAGGEAAKLMQMVSGNPAAKKGLQKAFADHLMEVIQTTAKDVAGNPVVSNAAFQRTMGKYAPVMRVLYRGEPQKIAALNTMRKAYEIASRNKRSPIGGGSDTAENILTELGKSYSLSRTGAALKGILGVISKHGDQKANELVSRALFDPDYAQVLIDASRGKIPEKQLQAAINDKIVRLDDFRKARQAASIAGLGAAASGDQE